MKYHWTCNCCGKSFDNLPLDYAYEGPLNWFALSETERAKRAKIDSNLCIIDGREFYVRGCLEIPFIGHVEKLVFGVWVSVSEASFKYVLDHWDGNLPDDEPPRFAWLMNWVEGYPEPNEIKCHLHIRPDSQRPLIILEPTDYPLAEDQRYGVSLELVKQLAIKHISH